MLSRRLMLLLLLLLMSALSVLNGKLLQVRPPPRMLAYWCGAGVSLRSDADVAADACGPEGNTPDNKSMRSPEGDGLSLLDDAASLPGDEGVHDKGGDAGSICALPVGMMVLGVKMLEAESSTSCCEAAAAPG